MATVSSFTSTAGVAPTPDEVRQPFIKKNLADLPYRRLPYIDAAVEVDYSSNGEILMRSPVPLLEAPVRTLSEWLPHWAQRRGDLPMLARRGTDGAWNYLTWGNMWDAVQRIGSALLQLPLSKQQPLMALSGNSLEYAVLKLAADYVGIPFVPVSPSYSAIAGASRRLQDIHALVQPGMIFVQSAALYAEALAALSIDAARVITVSDCAGQISYASLLQTDISASFEAAHEQIDPEDMCSIFFTSGSTGMPKGVVCSYRMLVTAQQMAFQLYRKPPDTAPVYLDWLPWHHAFGGMANFSRLLRHGATHYIDDGRPTESNFGETLKNLREISPDALNGVPLLFSMLAPELQKNPELARSLFSSRLESLTYGGAGLVPEIWNAMQHAAVAVCGEKIPFLSGLGATETSSLGVFFHWTADVIGNIGLPLPGCELKLVPLTSEGRYEVRMRGPNVFKYYLALPELSAKAFDEDGYYRMGDAVTFMDPADPSQGLRFAGRMNEDFKLSNGTWIVADQTRLQLLNDLAPLIRELVLCGRDRDYLGALAWLNEQECRRLLPELATATVDDLVRHPQLQQLIRASLMRQSARSGSFHLQRLALMGSPPDIKYGEVTDKGVSQMAVLQHRVVDVDMLYQDPPAANVVALSAAGT